MGSVCSFGIFNYDSFVSFRAIGVIWGIRELTAELVCLLFWHSSLSLPCGGLCFVPYPAMGPIIKDKKTICTWTARE